MNESVEFKSVVLDIVKLESLRLIKEQDLWNAQFHINRDRIAGGIAIELVQKLAQYKVQKPIVVKYPATWWDAVKDHWCPKIQKLRWLPKWAKEPFYNCVEYTAVTITADAFYDQLVIQDEHHFVRLWETTGRWNPNVTSGRSPLHAYDGTTGERRGSGYWNDDPHAGTGTGKGEPDA